eukprot:Sspe_Gene.59105::Locus_32461_Transcript_1_1_Confidence_1.000_Length_1688::g.59105::m.59105/K01192/E3.2.1.25, MANBA, manB; beta-mannosidase
MRPAMLLLAFLALGASAAEVIDLTGTWKVHNSNRSIHLHAQVPGQIHTDLMAAKVIGDPYYRFNDVEYRWIAYENWTYSRSFTIHKTHAYTKAHTFTLVAHGLDTAAEVFINHHKVLVANNMFRTWRVEIPHHLIHLHNEITVSFESAITYAARQARTYPIPTPPDHIPPACRPEKWHGECHGNFIRKEQCSFSWDWGPAFAPVGIYLPIAIEITHHPEVRSVRLHATPRLTGKKGTHDEEEWDITASVDVHPGVGGAATADVTLLSADGKVLAMGSQDVMLEGAEGVTDLTTVPVTLRAKVKRWWPRGYGDQHLYHIEAVVGQSKKTVRTGFREVRLVQDPVPGQEGRTFYFAVNGIPIFMKGANWIPSDSFESRIDRAHLEGLFESYVDANFNTLRIWGGGVYMKDEFYDLADELGLLVWEEFMFACSMYPVDPDFLETVTEEVKDQVRRLQHHVSIIGWSGNNENEAALVGNWYGSTWENKQYHDDYAKLYFTTVLETVATLDSSRPMVASSPSNGDETVDNPVERNVWYNYTNGDVHHYDYD